jgi:antitoxin FitA
MEGTPGLHDTLEQVLRQHQNWMDCQYLKPLAWMIVSPSAGDRTVISLISAVKDFPAQEEHDMAQLIVRNVDPEVVHRLKLRAAQHGRSMEAEHREILRQALLTSEPGVLLKAVLLAMPPVGDDADFARLPDQGREVEL